MAMLFALVALVLSAGAMLALFRSIYLSRFTNSPNAQTWFIASVAMILAAGWPSFFSLLLAAAEQPR